MKRILLTVFGSAVFFLAGCNATETPTAEKAVHGTQETDESCNQELLKQDLHDISDQEWEVIYLSKNDFDQYLSDLSKAGEAGMQLVANVKMNQGEIIITLNNRDGESLDNLFAAPYFDTLIRRLYVNSAYFDNQQPTIIVKDLNGTVLAENKEAMDTGKIDAYMD
ncbi:hypothetical protein [Planococcus salinus]|uniref:Uncharacterized protein n=1 Tax=Planococcus salinus TaxID=1848460 RepID=A0A3M8P3V7_9BACL|nr:hypothetical protein [Planococcus salinus]RNF38363.1 hypothetical protein EEX84_14690 [Planococcus salinus]